MFDRHQTAILGGQLLRGKIKLVDENVTVAPGAAAKEVSVLPLKSPSSNKPRLQLLHVGVGGKSLGICGAYDRPGNCPLCRSAGPAVAPPQQVGANGAALLCRGALNRAAPAGEP
eukprot:5650634-Pyramimonas_sp.AAC.1